MRNLVPTILNVAVFAVLLAGTAGNVGATEQEMNNLPAWERFACAICHVAETPLPGQAEFNPFGNDYFAHREELAGAAPVWDSFLAGLDSDQDGCSNGVELGDVDGNGQLDVGIVGEAGNPGLPGDCQSVNPLDESTWGALKSMFSTD